MSKKITEWTDDRWPFVPCACGDKDCAAGVEFAHDGDRIAVRKSGEMLVTADSLNLMQAAFVEAERRLKEYRKRRGMGGE